MANKKPIKGVTCTVGADQGDGVTELLALGVMIYVTPQTELVAGTQLEPGRKVLVDYRQEQQTFGATTGLLAVRVRPYGPAAEDVEGLRSFVERLTRAGLPDPGFGDPAAYLGKLFQARLQSGRSGPLDPLQELVQMLEAKDLRFPMDSWGEDVEPATSEMEEKLSARGITAPLPRAPIQAAFDAHADDDDAQAARRHFCAAIAREANALLTHEGRAERWLELADLPWEDDEPFWLLLTPAQYEGLLREKVFRPKA